MAGLVSRLLVDTDVLIDHLRGARTFRIPDGSDAAYSIITRAELYAGKRSTEQPIEQLLDAMVEIGISSDMATRAGGIRRDTGIGLADALIAATALTHGRVVLTRNDRHFAAVAELELASPEALA